AIAHQPVIEDRVVAHDREAVLAIPAQQALPLARRRRALRARIIGRGDGPHAEAELVADAGDETQQAAAMRRGQGFDADQLRPALGLPVDPGPRLARPAEV